MSNNPQFNRPPQPQQQRPPFQQGAPTQPTTQRPSDKKLSPVAIWFIVGLAVGVIAGWIWLRTTAEDVPVSDVATTTSESSGLDASADTALDGNRALAPLMGTTVVSSGGEEVRVKDQKAGTTVFVSQAVLSAPGWVAIRESRDGGMWNVLGAAWFDAGTKQGDVPLLRETVAGETYYAVLYRDDGDKKFDMKKDAMVLGDLDAPVAMTFEAYE